MLRKNLPILILAFAGAHAHAQSAYVQQTPGAPYPVIHVYSDSPTQWTRVGETDNGLTFHVDARGHCPDHWKTQHGSRLKVKSGGQDVAQANLGINKAHQNYGPDHGQGWEHLTFSGPYVNPQSPNSDPVAVCNTQLALRSAGAPDPEQRRRELLAGSFTHDVQRAYTADFALQCDDTGVGFQDSRFFTAEAGLYATVICHSNPAALDVPPPAPPQREPDPVGINSMDIWANPSASANYRGFCPKTIHFGGEIRYVLPANGNDRTVKYRYVATQGTNVFKSDVYTTKFTETGKKILKSWPLGFPLMTGGPQLSATTNSGDPDVYGGNVVLEFVNNPPIHANLKPVKFNITCLKEGQFAEAVMGGDNALASPSRPRDPFPTDDEPQPDPWQARNTTTAHVGQNQNAQIPSPTPGSKDPAPGTPEPGTPEPGAPEPGVPDPVIPSGGYPPGAVPAPQRPTQQVTQKTQQTQQQTAKKRPPASLTMTFPAQTASGGTNAVGGNKRETIGGNQSPTLSAAKPDLVIRSVERVPGSDRKLRVRVENIGNAPAPRSRLTLFPPNGKPISVTLQNVQITSYQIGVLDSPIPLTGTLRLQIDDTNRVSESNEANNSYVLTGVPHSAKDVLDKR